VGYRLLALIGLLVGCTSGGSISGPMTFHPDASCPVTIQSFVPADGVHVDVGTPVTYATNPPSSGQHYPIWATWGDHTTPVPRPYYVHNMEHGGVVLLYKCTDAASCTNAENFLKSVMDAAPADPSCTAPTRSRILVTRDDVIPSPFAAAAWGWTYVSDCPDMGSLLDFVKAHEAKGPEDLCANGSYQ
jgi:hypothetical protein